MQFSRSNSKLGIPPTANSQQPTANSQQPTANNTQPSANRQQPTANSQQPIANTLPSCYAPPNGRQHPLRHHHHRRGHVRVGGGHPAGLLREKSLRARPPHHARR